MTSLVADCRLHVNHILHIPWQWGLHIGVSTSSPPWKIRFLNQPSFTKGINQNKRHEGLPETPPPNSMVCQLVSSCFLLTLEIWWHIPLSATYEHIYIYIYTLEKTQRAHCKQNLSRVQASLSILRETCAFTCEDGPMRNQFKSFFLGKLFGNLALPRKITMFQKQMIHISLCQFTGLYQF